MNPAISRRMAKLVWHRVATSNNPWFNQAASSDDVASIERWNKRNREHLELCRALFSVVLEKTELTEDLLIRALDFLEE